MYIWIILAVALAAVLVGAALFLRWAYRLAFYFPDDKKKGDPHEFFGAERDMFCKEPMIALVDALSAREFEHVEITSRDGLRLCGRLYLEPNADKIQIVFHGWKGHALRDGCGGADVAHKRGHHLLLIDHRAHGESDGNVITFGIKEKYDCVDWANFIVERLGSDIKILLVGVSMGAATVLMASDLPLPPNVCGIVADCGYSSPEAIIRKVCRDMKIPDRIGYPCVRVAARLFGGFSLKDGGAIEAVKHTSVPILFIHGTGDDFVPYDMTVEMFNACASEKYLLSVKDAGHGLSFFYDRDAYDKTAYAFHDRVFR